MFQSFHPVCCPVYPRTFPSTYRWIRELVVETCTFDLRPLTPLAVFDRPVRYRMLRQATFWSNFSSKEISARVPVKMADCVNALIWALTKWHRSVPGLLGSSVFHLLSCFDHNRPNLKMREGHVQSCQNIIIEKVLPRRMFAWLVYCQLISRVQNRCFFKIDGKKNFRVLRGTLKMQKTLKKFSSNEYWVPWKTFTVPYVSCSALDRPAFMPLISLLLPHPSTLI